MAAWRMTLLMVVAAATTLHCGAATADIIVYSGGTYSNDFDGLPMTGSQTLSGKGPHSFLTDVSGVTGMDGWFLANPGGSSPNTEFRAHDGSLSSSSGRGVVSFGTDGSSDRALGALSTGNQISSFGAVFLNDSGLTLTDVSISFFGEHWRQTELINTLSFHYGFGDSIDDATTAYDSLDFSSLSTGGTDTAIDGNLPENRQFVSATISGLSWEAGQHLAIRWNMDEFAGQDSGIAIDDFQFSATAIPEPGSSLLGLIGVAALLLNRRRK